VRLRPGDPRHGTTAGYNYHRCHCQQCRNANAAYSTVIRRRRGVAARPPKGSNLTHGLRSTYVHGCHCDQCREAERRYKADLRRRKRIAAGAAS
jgi:hypothetical protein